MPSSTDILKFLSSLSARQITVSLLCTTSIIAIAGWRLSLLALLGQYILVGLLLSEAIRPEIAMVKAIVGGVVCPILYLTGYRIREEGGLHLGYMDLPFRLFVVFLGGIGAYGLLKGYPFPGVSADINLASYWLVAMGLLIVVSDREPFRVSLGLLTFESGFEMIYAIIERGLTIAGLLAAVNILTALAGAYLASMRREEM